MGTRLPHEEAERRKEGGSMKSIPINYVKRVLNDTEMTHVVLFAVGPDGTQHVATFGKTKVNAREAARAGNNLKAALGWNLDPASPLDRICKNCDFYKPDYGLHCFNGWSQDGSSGHCMSMPTRVQRNASDRACLQWEPKY